VFWRCQLGERAKDEWLILAHAMGVYICLEIFLGGRGSGALYSGGTGS